MDSFHLEYNGEPSAPIEHLPMAEVGTPSYLGTHQAALEMGELNPFQTTAIVVTLAGVALWAQSASRKKR